MTVISWNQFVQTNYFAETFLSATIGVFDGVHRGHQILLATLHEKKHCTPTVFTFTPNPSKVLQPQAFYGDIFTLPMRLEEFERLGIKLVVIIDFSKEFSKMKARFFIDTIVSSAKLEFVVLGKNFRFGHQEEMTAQEVENYYAERGIAVCLPSIRQIGDTPISSTRIREAILDGCLQTAADLLGSPFGLDMSHIEKEILAISSDSSSWSVAKSCFQQIVPNVGTYRGKCIMHHGRRTSPGIIEITKNELRWNSLEQWQYPVEIERIEFC